MRPEQAREVATSLREIADWFEANADAIDCNCATISQTYIWCVTPEQFATCARLLGKFDKDASGGYFNATRQFGETSIQATIERENLCRRIVKKRVVPAKPEMIVPAEPEHEIEEVEYECPQSILALANESQP